MRARLLLGAVGAKVPTMPVEIVTWLLTQGPFAGIAALLLWDRKRVEDRHGADMAMVRKELADERTRNNELNESRLDETKVLIEVAQSSRTTMQALLATVGAK